MTEEKKIELYKLRQSYSFWYKVNYRLLTKAERKDFEKYCLLQEIEEMRNQNILIDKLTYIYGYQRSKYDELLSSKEKREVYIRLALMKEIILLRKGRSIKHLYKKMSQDDKVTADEFLNSEFNKSKITSIELTNVKN